MPLPLMTASTSTLMNLRRSRKSVRAGGHVGYTNFHLMTKALYEKYDGRVLPRRQSAYDEFMMDTLSQMQVLGLVIF